jgi:hypothetical protein
VGDPADRATEVAKAAVEKTTSRIDAFLEARRKQAVQNDTAEEAARTQYERERAEAIHIRNVELRRRFAAMGVSDETVENFLASLSEHVL